MAVRKKQFTNIIKSFFKTKQGDDVADFIETCKQQNPLWQKVFSVQ